MKEKKNRLQSYSNGYNGKAANHLAFQTRHANDSGNTRELDCCNSSDGVSKDAQTLIRISPTDDHHSAVSKYSNGAEDKNVLKSDGNNKNWLNTPELECSIIMNDYAIHKKSEPADLVPPVITSSEMFQENRNIYTDKGVLDCEPELIVCYKERNYNNVIEMCPNGYALHEESGDLHFELLIHDGAVLSGSDDNVHNTKECLSKEEANVISPSASKFKSLSDLMNLDDQNEDVLLQDSEKGAGIKIENDIAVEEPIVTRLLSMEKFGTRISFRSSMKSSNSQGDGAQQPEQVVEHADFDKRHQLSVSGNEYRYYSKSPSAASDVFNSSLSGSSMNIRQETEPNYKEGHSANTFKARRTGMDGNPACEVQNAGVEENCENIHQQPIAANKIVDSANPFSCTKSIQESPQQLQHERSSNSHANTHVPSPVVNEIDENTSFSIPGQACDGEDIIFDVSGQITHSGPVTDSGSTSMRSESSTTSARSFAFPVLKAEWTSSPVKMGSTNSKRELKKQHGRWKQGLLCCRF